MIKVEERIELESMEDVKDDLRDYLQTYVRQYNEMLDTYEWIKGKLDAARQTEWKRTLKSLREICQALDAGFDPVTPPKNWASGTLLQYMAPIPQHVREAIDRAEPIFTRARLLVHDPNVEHFQRPRVVDPIVTGFVDLAGRRHHFLIGQWDLKADLKFLENSVPIERSSQDVGQVLRRLTALPGQGQMPPETAQPFVDVRGRDWGEHITHKPGRWSYTNKAVQSKWVAQMTR